MQRKPIWIYNQNALGLVFLKSEMEFGMNRLKMCKVAWIDEIPIELLKPHGHKVATKQTKLSNQIYTPVIWPEDHTKAIMIPLEKKKKRQ